MDTFYKMFPQPVTVKTEVNTDIIDLETEIATPKDIVINWDKEVRRRLLCCLYPGNGNLFDDLMKSYVMLLKDKVVQFKDKQLLREKLLTHITIFNSHYRDVEGEFDEFVNYFDHMEEILMVYCNVELEINRHAPKPENVPNRYLKKVKSTSQRICRVLYNNLAHKTLHIIHVLLKMNYKHTNPVCQSVMKMIYRHFLLKPSIGTISDEEFCRYYLVFQRWKEISKDDEIKKMENIFSLKFKKAPDFCETNEIMKTILTPANYSITGIFTHIMDYRNAPIRAYFDYIKKKRIDEISTIVIDVDKATTNIETSENECSRLYNEISHSFSKEVVSSSTTKEAETEVTPLCIDSDSDDDVIETTESTGVCVIDDSDQDSIEYVYLENAATKKHKSRKKTTSLPVTSVIDLDCYVPPASTSRESSPSHLRDTASSPPTSRSSLTVPPPSSPSRSSLNVPPPSSPSRSSLTVPPPSSPSLPQASSQAATPNVNTPLPSESTFCDKLSDRVVVDASKDITRCSTTYKQTQPTYKTVEIQTDLVTTYPYYYGLVTPPSDQRLDENNPDMDMLQENQASSEINMELTRSRTDSENAQSDASFNDHNEIDMDDAPTTNPNLKIVIKKVETVTLNTRLDASFANLAINKNEVQAIDVAESVQSDKQNMDMAHESESDRDQSDMYESHPNSENDNYDSENQENLLDQSFESEETIIQSSVMKKEGCFDTKLLKTEDARNRKNDHEEVVTNLPEDTLNENVNNTNDNNDNANETIEVQMNESCNVENMNVVEDIPECEINADVQPSESTVPANETQCKIAEENLQQTKLPGEDIVDVPNITENVDNRTVKGMTNIIEDSLDKCDNSLKTKMVQNNKLNDKKVQKVMYTSESIRDTSLDTFSKFEDEMFSQLMSSNTNEFDDVLNGPVSAMNGLNCKNQFFENSNDNFDLFGFVKNQSLNSFGLGNGMRNSKKSPSVSRSNSPTDSPAYEEIDTNDFRHYMEQGEINLLGDGKSEQPGNSKQDSRKTRGILHKGVEEETLNHHGNQKRKRSRQVNKKRSVVFCEVVDTRFVESRSEEEGLDYSNFRYVKRNNIKCFIDPDDVKLTQDSRVVFELGFCETYLSKQNQCMNEPSQANYIFNRPKHNTVKTSILQRIDFDKTDKAGTRLEDLSAKETEEFFNSASNYVPTTGNNHPGEVEAERLEKTKYSKKRNGQTKVTNGAIPSTSRRGRRRKNQNTEDIPISVPRKRRNALSKYEKNIDLSIEFDKLFHAPPVNNVKTSET